MLSEIFAEPTGRRSCNANAIAASAPIQHLSRRVTPTTFAVAGTPDWADFERGDIGIVFDDERRVVRFSIEQLLADEGVFSSPPFQPIMDRVERALRHCVIDMAPLMKLAGAPPLPR